MGNVGEQLISKVQEVRNALVGKLVLHIAALLLCSHEVAIPQAAEMVRHIWLRKTSGCDNLADRVWVIAQHF
jgi:hypothetical protein